MVAASFAIASGLESCFYASVRAKPEGRFYWVQEKCTKFYHRFQALFNATNFASLMYSDYKVAKLLYYSKGYSFSDITFLHPYRTLASFIIGFVIPNLYFLAGSCYKKDSSVDNCHVEEKIFWGQKLSQSILIARTVYQVASCLIVASNIATLFSVGTALYSLYLSTRIQWIQFSQSYNTPPELIPAFGTKRITFVYQFLALKLNNPTEKCIICFDRVANIAFDTNHSFCKPCTIDHVRTKIRNIMFGSKLEFFKFKILRTRIPNCPVCRSVPKTHRVHAKVFSSSGIQRQKLVYFIDS